MSVETLAKIEQEASALCRYLKGGMISHAVMAIAFQIANQHINGFQEIGAGQNSQKNLRAYLFNKELLNETTFSEIYLDGQCL